HFGPFRPAPRNRQSSAVRATAVALALTIENRLTAFGHRRRSVLPRCGAIGSALEPRRRIPSGPNRQTFAVRSKAWTNRLRAKGCRGATNLALEREQSPTRRSVAQAQAHRLQRAR